MPSKSVSSQGGHPPRDGRPDSYGIDSGYVINALVDAVPTLVRLADSTRVPRSRRGRPATYPDWVFLFVQAAVAFGSQREAVSTVASYWRLLIAAAKEHRLEPLPATPPRRHHWRHWVEKKAVPNVEQLSAAFTEVFVGECIKQGMLAPDAARSFTQPDLGQFLIGDAKLYDPPSRQVDAETVNEKTGEVTTHRVDPASRFGRRGNNPESAWGAPYVTLTVKRPGYRNNFVVAIDYIPKGVSEPDAAICGIDRILATGARPQGMLYDGAIRGVHVDRIMERGMLAVSPVYASKRGDGGTSRSTKNRIEKERLIEVLELGSCRHELFGVGGHPVLGYRNDRGKLITDHILEARLQVRGARDDRWYQVVRIPCDEGDLVVRGQRFHEHRIALRKQPGDTAKGLNRSEVLRQMPPHTVGHSALYGQRNNAETYHSMHDRAMDRGYVPAYGRPRQTIMLLGFAMAQNFINLKLSRERRAAQDAA